MSSTEKDQILSAIRDGDTRLAHELMAQSHFALCNEISLISEKVSQSASRRDVDRALGIFSSLIVASLAFFTAYHR
jgi:hypothetical protein